MTGYRAYRFYSPGLDAAAVRLSMADGQGREYYAIVAEVEAGRRWRDRRDEVLGAIEDAIVAGDDPGEVMV